MKLTESERKAIVKYRIERAHDTFLDVELAINNLRLNNAANRLYYACYYAAMALLINNEYEARTHDGVKTLIGLHFVKNNIISEELMRAYRRMFNLRQTGDYDDLAVITLDDVLELYEPAKQFIETIEKLINN